MKRSGGGAGTPRRRTIGRDPLADRREDVTAPDPARSLVARERRGAVPAVTGPSQSPRRSLRWRDAVGGRLELLGGDLGRGNLLVELFGTDRLMGVFLGDGEFIDLETRLQSIHAWPDHAEQRVWAVIGWAWAFGVVAGTLGVIVGGGLRLLHPRHMIFEMRLRDGRYCIGRTDGVTVGALDAIARDLAT